MPTSTGSTKSETALRFSNLEIADYYDTHQSSYSRFWSRTALHYGFWYENTKVLSEAIENTNRFVVEVLGIDERDVVLDAGCGVGGSSLYVAETIGARVEGITLSGVQLQIASRMAAQSVASRLLSFSLQDYMLTKFSAGTFSKIFGIESICHANEKKQFLDEAYRLLCPGGKLAVVDAFLVRDGLSCEEQLIYRKSTAGWRVPNLASIEEFRRLLVAAGFEENIFRNMQAHVEKSVRRIYRLGLVTSVINLVKCGLGLARENQAARYQRTLFDRKIAVYGVFVATKPENSATNERLRDHDQNRNPDGQVA
jgi:tocopherol O-methyltransferase